MRHNLQRNFLNLVFIIGLLFTGGQSFAQDTEAPSNSASAESPTGPAIQEEHDTKDLEKLLIKYNTDQQKVLEDANKLHNIETANPKSDVSATELDKETNTVVNENTLLKNTEERHRPVFIPSDLSNSVRLALEPLQKLSEKELLSSLEESTRKSELRPYMNEFPHLILFTVRLIKDKESIPTMVKILEDKERLIWFTSTMLFTLLFAVVLKRIMFRENRSFLRASTYFLIRVFVMFSLRIGIIYYFYSVEFTPAAKVFSKTFF